MRISIALATYNGARFLREQLDSLYAQSRRPDEVVVSDDGSTDDTLAILEEYHLRFGLSYSVNEGKHGVNANFFRAMSLTTGDYVMICDQDDIWLSNKVEVLEQAITSLPAERPAVATAWHGDIDATGNILIPLLDREASRGWQANLMSTDHTQGCGMIMNRPCLEKVLELSDRVEGVFYDVVIDFVANTLGEKFNTGRALMYYRHHEANVVARVGREPKTFWQKVSDMQLYYPFIQSYRFREMATMYPLCRHWPIPDDIRRWLETATRIDQAANIFVGLRLILGIPELTAWQKTKISILTPVVAVLKKINPLNNTARSWQK